ncbi:hypothetical protein DID75_05075 [Candidatus Marinamargulisbacteria bacterium SCGC AG-410-N11]|nr:hypothetical protein DID75_05075 [Candidatus Marinamargulisbacteria bacterium SCGC AG-410-N11]
MLSQKRIQSLVPRSLSLGHLVSKSTWKRGIGNFFIEDIPFSYSSGQVFANDLKRLFFDLGIFHDKKNHIYELGAGNGYLMQHLFESMKSDILNGSLDVCFHLTDSYDSYVKEVSDRFSNESFSDYFIFEKINASNPIYNEHPDIVIMAYLLDSMDTRHFEVVDGKLFELQIETYFTDVNQFFIHTQESLPKLYRLGELSESFISENKLAIFSQCSEFIEEKYVRVSIENTDLPVEEIDHLNLFINEFNISNSIFNYSSDVRDGLISYFSHFGEYSIGCIYDFGYLNLDKPIKKASLVSNYGVCKFYSVFYPYLKFLAGQFKINFQVSNFDPGHSQFAIFYRKLDTNKISQFLSGFEESLDYRLSQLADHVKRTYSGDAFFKKFEIEVKKLNTSIYHSYYIVMYIALIAFDQKHYQKVIDLCQYLIKQYKCGAISAYHLLGVTYHKLENYDFAIDYLIQGLELSSQDSRFYHELTLIFLKKGDIEKVKLYFSKTIYYSLVALPWNLLVLYLLIMFQKEKNLELFCYMKFFIECYDVSDSLVSRSFCKQYKILNHYLMENKLVFE